MTSTAPGGAHLENVMYRLVDYLSGEKADHHDTMLMISLVNLLGIISVMNKQWAPGLATPRPAGEDPLIAALLKMLEGQHGERGGPPALDPALLFGLLGPQAQKPENALLLALLNKMMQPRPQNPPFAERKRQDTGEGTGGPDNPSAGGRADQGRTGSVLNWGRRLG